MDAEGDRKSEIGSGKATLWEGFKWIKWNAISLQSMAEIPCAGGAILTGLFGGLLMGISRKLISKNTQSAVNYGFGSTIILTLISWEYCRYQRNVSRESLAMLGEAHLQNQKPSQ